MSEKKTVVVVGLGEVGKPLSELLSEHYQVVGIDIDPPKQAIGAVSILHICYPFEIRDFVGETAKYIEKFKPSLTIINSTVGVGTTRKVAERSGARVVHSPVRGKHARMLQEMKSYTKYVGAMDPEAGREAAQHFAAAGLNTRILATPEASELGKLCETTFFGVMIAWAQEVERYCDQWGANYEEVISLYDEIKFFPPVKYFPGVIGGHCVMPNIKILQKFADSNLLKAVEASNSAKLEREANNSAEPVGAKAAGTSNGR